ncbi:MAG TPA: GNAT family N-acetyltransferase [Actinocrinis sp.]|nr:GNAT family N-acetyltransferase [Actinocrinis sp.]
MQIREIHPAADPAALAAIQRVAQAAFSAALPNFPDVAPARLLLETADQRTSEGVSLAAFAHGQTGVVLGYANLRFELTDNLDMAFGDLWVDPAARRQGVGSALHAEALQAVAARERSVLMWQGPATADPEAFAAYHQGKTVERVTRSVLDLRAVDRARFAALAGPSPANAGYRAVRWTDHCPPDLVDNYCAAQSAMQDAPTGDSGYEIAAVTPEKLAAGEDGSVAAGARRHVVAMVDEAGEIAAFHSFFSFPGEPRTLEVWDTGVVQAHRGHGLGVRIKAEGTMWAMADYPEAYWLQTFNNADNGPMLRVNLELGYEASEDWIRFEFAVPNPV